MSVLVSDRTESKFEAITYSIELHDMRIDFMQHGFGVKSVDDYVRLRYAYGKDDRENFSKYRFMMQNFKNRVDQLAALITNNVRAVNTICPIDTPLFIGIIAEILGHANLESIKEYVKISTAFT